MARPIWSSRCSPHDRYRRTARKVREYLAAGALLVLTVDPEECAAAVHRPDGAMDEYEADGEIDLSSVVPGFVLKPADVWVDAEEEQARPAPDRGDRAAIAPFARNRSS